jgi:hypothetical protein
VKAQNHLYYLIVCNRRRDKLRFKTNQTYLVGLLDCQDEATMVHWNVCSCLSGDMAKYLRRLVSTSPSVAQISYIRCRSLYTVMTYRVIISLKCGAYRVLWNGVFWLLKYSCVWVVREGVLQKYCKMYGFVCAEFLLTDLHIYYLTRLWWRTIWQGKKPLLRCARV